jgi:AraC-like DNA-binding protein/mannose-6-phosphate isomerase-like protein (cupin superfamily)
MPTKAKKKRSAPWRDPTLVLPLEGLGQAVPINALSACSQMRFPVGWHIAPHVHERRNEISVVLQGKHRIAMEGRIYDAVPGDVLSYPAQVVHEEWCVGEEPLVILFFSWADCGSAVGIDMPRYVQDRQGRIRFLAQWIIDLKSQVSDPHKAPASIQTMFGLLLSELCHVHQPPPDERLERVRRHIHARLAEPVGIDELSRIAGLSRFHLIRVFRARYGVTPMDYLRKQRLENVRIMLRSSDQNLKQIASMLGFSDEFHLSKSFKAAVGVSPSDYRRMGESA